MQTDLTSPLSQSGDDMKRRFRAFLDWALSFAFPPSFEVSLGRTDRAAP